MKICLLLLLCFFSFKLSAQNISGLITDESDQPLPGAGIKVYRVADSVLVRSLAAGNKGHFTIQQAIDCYLVISYTGYQAQIISALKLNMVKGNLGQIRLKADTRLLKQVNIAGQQPIVQQKIDRTVISVNSRVLQLADNALEVIKLAPGIIISDNEDAIQLSGKDGVAVMINDKVVKLSSRDLVKLLKAMPAGTVSQLEVMNNPSAKYDITGNTGLLNIKTKQNAIKGITGNIDLESSQGGHNMGDLSGLLNYGTAKLAASAYLAYHYGWYQSYYTKQTRLTNALLNQQNINIDKWSDPVTRLTLDYFINSKQTIGGLVEREASTNTGSYETEAVLNRAGIGDSTYNTDGYNPNVRHWNTYNLNYRFADTLGTEFSMDWDRSDYKKNDRSNVTNTNSAANQTGNQYRTLTGISINTLKGDYTHNWKNKTKLEAGFKLSDVSTDNSLTVNSINNGLVKADNRQDNSFLYQERVNSLYTNVGRNYKKWGLQIGFRVEQSRIKGLSTDHNDQQTKKPDSSYINLLPAVYLTYQPAGDHNLRLSLNQRIKRPAYSDLQPFSYQLDPFDYEMGNPALRVQRNTNAELTYTYRNRITLTSSYTHTTDFFNPVIYQIGAVTYQTTQNTGTMDNWNFNLNYPVKVTKWWNMLNKLNGFYNHFNGQLYQGVLDAGKWSYLASTSQRFTLPDKLMLQLSARYNSPVQNLIYRQGGSGNVSLSINRKLFNDNATFRITVSDIFKTQRNDVLVNFGSLYYLQRNTWDSQRIGGEFTWRFGNKKIKQTQERERGNREEKGRS